jgi:magnesium-transporting ATPase (P-type)
MNNSYFYTAIIFLLFLIIAYVFFWFWAFRKYPHQTTNRVCIGALITSIAAYFVPHPDGKVSANVDFLGITSVEPVTFSFSAIEEIPLLGLYVLITLISILCLHKLPPET